jgi:2-isopropylmalate synthase
VDLRDGNQALVEPMNVEQKRRLWDLLVKVGLKEIEVGFPSASQPDFDFVRSLIDNHLIPDDVTIQVLVQAREELIARTFEALVGVKRAVVHVYNSVSPAQREYVFGLDKSGIKAIAVQGAKWVRDYAANYPQTQWSFEYSPESFSSTETEYAVEVCDAVVEQWLDSGNPLIINLPATVEVSTPNVYADQIEWFCRNSKYRDRYCVSVHTHNDRACGVAAAELAVMAGADRVEGTLLGNGERTGNMDLVTMGMNLYSQGIDPMLDFSNMDEIIAGVTACTQIPVHPRHPWAGDLVFTAFSGSHQDAIRKCLGRQSASMAWDVAYLPIDPADIGRRYEDVIRINSQSGKGGVAYVLEQQYGLRLPRWLQIDTSRVVQKATEQTSGELSPNDIWQLFDAHYLAPSRSNSIRRLHVDQDGVDKVHIELDTPAGHLTLAGEGNGALTALVDALQRHHGGSIDVLDYQEHAIDAGTDSKAVAYVLVVVNGERVIGVALGNDVLGTSMQAVINAVNSVQPMRRRA